MEKSPDCEQSGLFKFGSGAKKTHHKRDRQNQVYRQLALDASPKGAK